jgi:hypothetical protein
VDVFLQIFTVALIGALGIAAVGIAVVVALNYRQGKKAKYGDPLPGWGKVGLLGIIYIAWGGGMIASIYYGFLTTNFLPFGMAFAGSGFPIYVTDKILES